MLNVAILTPSTAHAAHEAVWPIVLGRVQRVLEGAGITCVPTPWTNHVRDASGLRGYACVLPLLAWGYHFEHTSWLQACETWQREEIPLLNPAHVLAWNSDKGYLSELAAKGVAVPLTRWCRALSSADVELVLDATGADEVIVKPPVSGGAWKTVRLRRGESLGAHEGSTMLVQPYLPTIASLGETSFLYFGGRLSHVVNKRPQPGEFRVQQDFGGQYTLVTTPPPEAVALARQVLDALPEPLLYARIDMVPDADGRWLLMETELIEPDFYLGVDPAQGANFARALKEAVKNGVGCTKRLITCQEQ